MECVVAQLIFGALAILDVAQPAREPLGLAVVGARCHAAREHPTPGAILATHAVLAGEPHGGVGQVRVDVGAQAGQVVGMNAREPLVGRVAELFGRIPEQAGERLGVADALRAQVPVEQAIAGALCSQLVALAGAALDGDLVHDAARGVGDASARAEQRQGRDEREHAATRLAAARQPADQHAEQVHVARTGRDEQRARHANGSHEICDGIAMRYTQAR